jgi:hypothetical protein
MRTCPSAIAVLAALIAGCAGQPADVTPASTPQSGDASRPSRAGKYTVRERNGVKLYCVDQKILGSHARFSELCMTESEWKEAEYAVQRQMDREVRPQGKQMDR